MNATISNSLFTRLVLTFALLVSMVALAPSAEASNPWVLYKSVYKTASGDAVIDSSTSASRDEWKGVAYNPGYRNEVISVYSTVACSNGRRSVISRSVWVSPGASFQWYHPDMGATVCTMRIQARASSPGTTYLRVKFYGRY